MKKSFILFGTVCFLAFFNSILLAGGIDNRSNYSGEYVRTLNRNAATDSLDAVVYNPAGVMMMENGNHGNFSVHYVLKDYSNTVNGIVLEQDTPSLVPAMFGLFKGDKWAGFMAFTIPAGGGEVDYSNGSATTKIGATGLVNTINATAGASLYGPVSNERLEGEAFYYGFTAGAAYKLNETFSFSLAGRYINANKKLNASFRLDPTALGTGAGASARNAVLDYEDRAEGFGLIFGMNINCEELNIGMRYETETVLDFEYDLHADAVTGLPAGLGASMGIINDREHPRNLPALFAIGAGYELNPKLRLDLNLTSYFQEDADWGGAENNVDDGWEWGIALEYKVNQNMKWSAGYLYTKTGMDAKYALKEAPELNANSFGAGFVYSGDNYKIDCGLGLVDYESDSYTDMSSGTPLVIGLEKDVVMLSAGIQYSF